MKRNEVVYVIVVPVPNPVDANKSLRATIAFSARKRGSKRQTEFCPSSLATPPVLENWGLVNPCGIKVAHDARRCGFQLLLLG